MKNQKKPRPNACCNIPSNMDIQYPQKDVVIETCKVCGCRHFSLKVDPGKLNSKMV